MWISADRGLERNKAKVEQIKKNIQTLIDQTNQHGLTIVSQSAKVLL